MGYVYTITNKIDGKIYVGMSEREDENVRWKEHQKDYKYFLNCNRPLYDAINLYGIENFEFNIIERTEFPKEREIFWIHKLNTYIGNKDNNGYNATLGGDSRKLAFSTDEEVDQLKFMYSSGLGIRKIAKELHHSYETISIKLKQIGYDIQTNNPISVIGINYNTLDVISFNSMLEASQNLHISSGKISECIKGTRKRTGEFIWIKKEDINKIDIDKLYNDIDHLRYLSDQRNKKKITGKTKRKQNQKIVCIESKLVFQNATIAAKWSGLASARHIYDCLSNNRKHAGKHPKTGKSLSWMYYDEYIGKYNNTNLRFYDKSKTFIE